MYSQKTTHNTLYLQLFFLAEWFLSLSGSCAYHFILGDKVSKPQTTSTY